MNEVAYYATNLTRIYFSTKIKTSSKKCATESIVEERDMSCKKPIVSLGRKYLSRKMNCINHFPKYNTFPVAKKFGYKKVKNSEYIPYSQT